MPFAEVAADVLTDPQKQMKVAAEVGDEEAQSAEERAKSRRLKAILYTLAGIGTVGLGSYFLLKHPDKVAEGVRKVFGGEEEPEQTAAERLKGAVTSPSIAGGLAYLGAGTRTGASYLPRTLQKFPFFTGDRALSLENLRKHIAAVSTPEGQTAAAQAKTPDQRLGALMTDLPELEQRRKLHKELGRARGREGSILNLIAADPKLKRIDEILQLPRAQQQALIKKLKAPARTIPGLSGLQDVRFMKNLERGLGELAAQEGRKTPGAGERARAVRRFLGADPETLHGALRSYRKARAPRSFWGGVGRAAVVPTATMVPGALETYEAWTD